MPLDERGVWIDDIRDCDCGITDGPSLPVPTPVPEMLPAPKGSFNEVGTDFSKFAEDALDKDKSGDAECSNVSGGAIMVRFRRLTVVALVLVAALCFARPASAGPVLDWLFPDDGPAPTYSPLRCWAPRLGRINDDAHGPKLSIYATNLHPEIQPNYTILSFPCPPVLPAATIIPTPTPPATSRFKY